MNNNKYITKFLVLFLGIFIGSIFSQNKTILRGKIVDDNGKNLPYVNVYILNSTDGSMTDDNGKFYFKTSLKGKVKLIASMVGYKKFERELDLSKKIKNLELNIILQSEIVELEEAIVMGSSFGSKKGKGIVIKAMDVMTTPGGAADIFQSLKTMPGLTQVSESAQLYVRGGDPSETITLIDQASVYHPYTLESSYGGLFSNLNTISVSNMYFSSGGFSVKYGNVLSGVLDIETKNLPLSQSFNLGVSMALASISGAIPIVDDKLGFRFHAQQSYTKPIMWLNGAIDAFTTTPVSKTLNASLIYKYSETGKLKLFGLFADDNQGVNVERAEYDGTFNGNSNNNFINLQLTDIIYSDILLKSSVSFNQFNNVWKLGILDLTQNDDVFQFRSDLEKIFTPKFKIVGGAEIERRTRSYLGTIPKEEYDIRNKSESKLLNEKDTGTRLGVYAEIRRTSFLDIKELFGIAGIRVDYVPELSIYSLDPRFGFGYKLNKKATLKLGYGIFHQIPDSRLFSESDGNPNLEFMNAIHYVISFDYKIDKDNSFRLEGYYKDYNNLPLKNNLINYDNKGNGFAEGIDMIFKGKISNGLSGWLSYGYINTKRRWLDNEKLTNSDFDITHNLSLVAKYNLSAMWQIGVNFKYATGRPFTPIISSVYRNGLNIYEPIYGDDNSERYPDYKRLDIRITHLNRIFEKYFAVFYIETLNILNFNNLFGYSYNNDYSKRKVIKSYFGRRTIVIGTNISF